MSATGSLSISLTSSTSLSTTTTTGTSSGTWTDSQSQLASLGATSTDSPSGTVKSLTSSVSLTMSSIASATLRGMESYSPNTSLSQTTRRTLTNRPAMSVTLPTYSASEALMHSPSHQGPRSHTMTIQAPLSATKSSNDSTPSVSASAPLGSISNKVSESVPLDNTSSVPQPSSISLLRTVSIPTISTLSPSGSTSTAVSESATEHTSSIFLPHTSTGTDKESSISFPHTVSIPTSSTLSRKKNISSTVLIPATVKEPGMTDVFVFILSFRVRKSDIYNGWPIMINAISTIAGIEADDVVLISAVEVFEYVTAVEIHLSSLSDENAIILAKAVRGETSALSVTFNAIVATFKIHRITGKKSLQYALAVMILFTIGITAVLIMVGIYCLVRQKRDEAKHQANVQRALKYSDDNPWGESHGIPLEKPSLHSIFSSPMDKALLKDSWAGSSFVSPAENMFSVVDGRLMLCGEPLWTAKSRRGGRKRTSSITFLGKPLKSKKKGKKDRKQEASQDGSSDHSRVVSDQESDFSNQNHDQILSIDGCSEDVNNAANLIVGDQSTGKGFKPEPAAHQPQSPVFQPSLRQHDLSPMASCLPGFRPANQGVRAVPGSSSGSGSGSGGLGGPAGVLGLRFAHIHGNDTTSASDSRPNAGIVEASPKLSQCLHRPTQDPHYIQGSSTSGSEVSTNRNSVIHVRPNLATPQSHFVLPVGAQFFGNRNRSSVSAPTPASSPPRRDSQQSDNVIVKPSPRSTWAPPSASTDNSATSDGEDIFVGMNSYDSKRSVVTVKRSALPFVQGNNFADSTSPPDDPLRLNDRSGGRRRSSTKHQSAGDRGEGTVITHDSEKLDGRSVDIFSSDDSGGSGPEDGFGGEGRGRFSRYRRSSGRRRDRQPIEEDTSTHVICVNSGYFGNRGAAATSGSQRGVLFASRTEPTQQTCGDGHQRASRLQAANKLWDVEKRPRQQRLLEANALWASFPTKSSEPTLTASDTGSSDEDTHSDANNNDNKADLVLDSAPHTSNGGIADQSLSPADRNLLHSHPPQQQPMLFVSSKTPTSSSSTSMTPDISNPLGLLANTPTPPSVALSQPPPAAEMSKPELKKLKRESKRKKERDREASVSTSTIEAKGNRSLTKRVTLSDNVTIVLIHNHTGPEAVDYGSLPLSPSILSVRNGEVTHNNSISSTLSVNTPEN